MNKDYIVVTKERMVELLHKAMVGDNLSNDIQEIINDPVQWDWEYNVSDK